MTLDGVRPRVETNLTTKEILIDPWLPPSSPPPTQASATPAVPAGSGGSREWSRDLIDTSGFFAADGRVTLTADKVIYGAYVVDSADLAATLENGRLDLEKLNGGLFGGTVKSNGWASGGDKLKGFIRLDVAEADIRQAAETAANAGQVTGSSITRLSCRRRAGHSMSSSPH